MKKSHSIRLNPLSAAIALAIAVTPALAFDHYAHDHDRDGLTYAQELEHLTDAYNPDTDGGGAHDGWEVANGFDPKDPSDDVNVPADLDIDNDGIGNPEEGADTIDADSDQDGLTDTFEAGLPDADLDGFIDDLTDINNNGMPDIAEALAVSGDYPDFDGDGTPDYLDADADNDGVPDKDEYETWGIPDDRPYDLWDIDGDGFLNGHDTDADGDGKPDSVEYQVAANGIHSDLDGDRIPDYLDPDDNTRLYLPQDADIDTSSDDMDHDGLSNTDELEIYDTDRLRADTDGGGAYDNWEIELGFDPNDPADDINVPVDIDVDNDGVLNEFEGTNVKDADSDGDGASDAIEIGLVDANNDGFLDDLTDVNVNGMPDVAEAIAASLVYPDFDGDGIPNYLDIDSDNDGVHDVLEYSTAWVPEGYVGNPLDVDGDGQLNALDYDSDGDGILDFDEQRVGSISKVINPITRWHEYRSPTVNGLGQVHQLGDDDGDGIPNQADADVNGGADSDGDGIANSADVDRPRVWNRQDDCVLYYCYLVRNYDTDGDGVENDFDWDSNNDGALDLTDSAQLYDTDDNDGIPAIFDDDDQSAYVPETVDTNVDTAEETATDITDETTAQAAEETTVETDTQVTEESTTETVEVVTVEASVEESNAASIETTAQTDTSDEAPETGAASSTADGGALGLWTLLVLGFTRLLSSARRRKQS